MPSKFLIVATSLNVLICTLFVQFFDFNRQKVANQLIIQTIWDKMSLFLTNGTNCILRRIVVHSFQIYLLKLFLSENALAENLQPQIITNANYSSSKTL